MKANAKEVNRFKSALSNKSDNKICIISFNEVATKNEVDAEDSGNRTSVTQAIFLHN